MNEFYQEKKSNSKHLATVAQRKQQLYRKNRIKSSFSFISSF